MTRTLMPTEHQEQAIVIQWAETQKFAFPEARLIFAVPNGGHRPQKIIKGKSVPIEGRKLQAEGVRAGIPDLFLPVARNGYHGLFIEMKRRNGSVSPDQASWALALRNQNYHVEICKGADAAISAIQTYLS